MITVIEQTTAERKQETKELFEQIKPLLDKGMIYSNAVRKVREMPENSSRSGQAWYKELVAYGETQGYPFNEYSGRANNKYKE